MDTVGGPHAAQVRRRTHRLAGARRGERPWQRRVKPWEAANTIAYCLFDDAGMMTGNLIDVDQSLRGAGNPSIQTWDDTPGPDNVQPTSRQALASHAVTDTDLPVMFFDAALPEPYADLVAGRAVAVGPDQGLDRARAVIAGARIAWDTALIAQAPWLEVISRTGVGYDNIDVAAAAAAGVTVCNAPAAPTVSTAEHTVALLLAVTKRLPAQFARARAGIPAAPTGEGLELDGRVLGLVGFGRIATRVAVAAQGLGMHVIAHDPFLTESTVPGVELVDLETVFRDTDVVSVHAPATEATHHLVDSGRLAMMRPGSYLVNCARGSLVDQVALLAALDSGHLAGAALDVTEPEPLPEGHPLLGRDDIIITPHVASSTIAGRRRLYEHAVDNALAVLDGRTATIVQP